jgi:hypothetical protein
VVKNIPLYTKKNLVIRVAQQDTKNKQIQIDLDITRGILRSTLTFEQLRNKNKTQSYSGRLILYTKTNEQNLLYYVRRVTGWSHG